MVSLDPPTCQGVLLPISAGRAWIHRFQVGFIVDPPLDPRNSKVTSETVTSVEFVIPIPIKLPSKDKAVPPLTP